MIDIIIIIVLGLIDSYREDLELVETNRWKPWEIWIKPWGETWDNNRFKKIFNSFHLLPGLVFWGLLALPVCNILRFSDILFNISLLPQALNVIAHYFALGLIFWYVRNVGMHVFWRSGGYKEYKYLLPIKYR